jgi:hypothetical protein
MEGERGERGVQEQTGKMEMDNLSEQRASLLSPCPRTCSFSLAFFGAYTFCVPLCTSQVHLCQRPSQLVFLGPLRVAAAATEEGSLSAPPGLGPAPSEHRGKPRPRTASAIL